MDTYIWLGVALAFFGLTWFLKRPDISAAKARELVGGGALLVDVRSAVEYSAGHIQGAKNIPVDALGARARELGDKGKTIILYCASGARSAAAKRMLTSAGFSSVYNLGSIRHW